MQENTPKPEEQEDGGRATSGPEFKNAKERFYDKIPVSVQTLDIIIKLLIAVVVVTVVLGIVAGRTA
ncbi:hypothetical protein [Hydrogenoanaerobacterium sp.]|uniref:hypothetical protein n=1 Tax=Hydrogenoanaerobacterium sp. TaxID=2953763 RepID=UPI002896B243|nr:hypothetical protein [Hydrogenoanaerobacterium sp.]